MCALSQSLVKSSWESRDQTTIIPQGVPYMVKLLRYYVSEDAVYLHLEHIKGKVATSGCVFLTRNIKNIKENYLSFLRWEAFLQVAQT